MPQKDIHAVLKEYWGYDSFRPLQEDIIRSVLAGRDTLALLPTGGGKSICFQVPAMVMDGICIVVSPLIALMKDQVEHLQKNNIKAVAIYSGMSRREIDRLLDNCIYGGYKFLYVSPERLQTDIFIERLKKMHVCLLAVDEAHCISQWGYDFRPPYLQIADIRPLIPDAKLIALTASATKLVREDIQDKLGFEEGEIFSKSFRRDNLSYSTFRSENKNTRILKILKGVKGTAIIYTTTRRQTKAISQHLKDHDISADYYHAGLSLQQRNQKQKAWMEGTTRVMVATNAFGMGIDKPDVRLVIHMGIPSTLEAYYQEAGRGGRDQKKAYAVLLFHDLDIQDAKDNAIAQFPPIKTLKTTYQALANHYQLAVGSGHLQTYPFALSSFVKNFDLDTKATYYALKILSQEGLIEMSEAFFRPSRVLINVDKTELYAFQIANKHYEPFLNTLVRRYGGGIFSDYYIISEEALAKTLKVSTKDLITMLRQLDQRNIILYESASQSPHITFLTPRVDASKLPLNTKNLEDKKAQHLQRVNAVIDYITNDFDCRSKMIEQYFGEKRHDDCGKCDVCLNKYRHDDRDYHAMIMETLYHDQPLHVKELIQKIEPKKIDDFYDVITKLLDVGAIIYDEDRKLILN